MSNRTDCPHLLRWGALMRRWSDAKLDRELHFALAAKDEAHRESVKWLAACEAETDRRRANATLAAIGRNQSAYPHFVGFVESLTGPPTYWRDEQKGWWRCKNCGRVNYIGHDKRCFECEGGEFDE